MSRKLKPGTIADIQHCENAVEHLKAARDLLTAAGARKSAERVRAAIYSSEGALRHAKRREQETSRQDAARLPTGEAPS